MLETFEDDARRAFLGAYKEARQLRHLRVDTSHLLLSLMAEDESVPTRVLNDNGVTVEKVLVRFFGVEAAPPWDQPARIAYDKAEYTAIIGASREEAEGSGAASVSALHLLAGLIRQPHGVATTMIRSMDVDTTGLLGRVRSCLMTA